MKRSSRSKANTVYDPSSSNRRSGTELALASMANKGLRIAAGITLKGIETERRGSLYGIDQTIQGIKSELLSYDEKCGINNNAPPSHVVKHNTVEEILSMPCYNTNQPNRISAKEAAQREKARMERIVKQMSF